MSFVLPSVKRDCKGKAPMVSYPCCQHSMAGHFTLGMVLTFVNAGFRYNRNNTEYFTR